MLVSELLKDLPPVTARKVYGFFQRAVKAGELPALKLLTRFELQGAKNQTRQVFDYAFTSSDAPKIREWMNQRTAAPKVGGLTAEQVQKMADEELASLIKAQQNKKKRKPRKDKTSTAETENSQKPSETSTETPQN